MARKGIRGRGSNQYADKTPSVVDSEAHNARVRKMKTLTTIHRPSGGSLGDQMDTDSTSSLAGRLSLSYDAHIEAFLGGAPSHVMKEKVEAIAAFTDGILTKHNDAYGQALVEGIHFVKNAKYDPEVRTALKREGSPEKVLLDNYGKILRDAVDGSEEKITLEELPEILDRLNDASIAKDRGESWGNERRSEPTLSSRFAATSVFCSRDPKNHSLQRELAALRNQLHERGVTKIDI